MTRKTPQTFEEYSGDWRDDELAVEMAKISLLEQFVAEIDRQNDALETIAMGDHQ